MSVKHPQYILAVESSALELAANIERGIALMSMDTFAEQMQGKLIIAQRAKLETDERYRQLLPYAVLFRREENGYRVYPYRRAATGGEARLHGNVSIGFGGHVDLVDVNFDENSVINLPFTLFNGCIRELTEELTISKQDLKNATFLEIGPLIDNSNDVGKVHMGYVLMIELQPDVQIISNEDAIVVMEPVTPQQLLDSGLPLESWTEVVLQALTNVSDKAEQALAATEGEQA